MSEHQEQAAVVAWAKAHERAWPELVLLHAVQNWAGVKSPREGARRKREGIKAGVPDLHLPIARCGFTSLFIEMKHETVKPGKRGLRRVRTYPTREQRAWHRHLRVVGNAVEVCWSAEQAQDVIRSYLMGTYECS